MSITTRTRIAELCDYPEAMDVLSEYGVEVGTKEMTWTLERLARAHGLNAWELKVDLIDALAIEGSTWGEGGLLDEDEEESGEEEEVEEEEDDELDEEGFEAYDEVDDVDDEEVDEDEDEDGDDDDDDEGVAW